MTASLHGYDLQLACVKCGLEKRIRRFPTAAAPALGDILTEDNISIFEKGCLRCGMCRFEVLTAPAQEPPPRGPTGWVPP